jgi:hypothetical protein
MVFFTFPEDARWNPDRMAVEFGVEIGEYRGVVRIPWRVFQHLLAITAHARTMRGRLPPEPDSA